MSEMQMGTGEKSFAEIIWANEPITSGELAKKSEEALGWKKTTSYTVLKRLCDKGLFQNEKGVVTSLLSKQDYYAMQSEQFVSDSFGGSLPAFFAAFTSRKKLSDSEVAELQRMIDEHKED
ncbi:MAG: BlaI/MecI/CopY family transcriptional regulator [Clostridia bacterium]|nr:BlaI/MecI/CopY family transcriptional regulator [Clostridia bacterium]MBQ8399293.1 BlaI/MecI/CopY family transcriptional regulator [Clostridia bacterium]